MQHYVGAYLFLFFFLLAGAVMVALFFQGQLATGLLLVPAEVVAFFLFLKLIEQGDNETRGDG